MSGFRTSGKNLPAFLLAAGDSLRRHPQFRDLITGMPAMAESTSPTKVSQPAPSLAVSVRPLGP